MGSKVYYYVYGFSQGKHWVQAVKYDPDFQDIVSKSLRLSPEELESKKWIRCKDDVKMLDNVKRDIPQKEEKESETIDEI
jgi:hypothetical protein